MAFKVELTEILKSGELDTPIVLTDAQFVADSADGTGAKAILAQKSLMLLSQNSILGRITINEDGQVIVSIDDDTPLKIGYKQPPKTPYDAVDGDDLVRKDFVDNILNDHIDDKQNPHEVTKDQLGLDKVDNTSDANKPISLSTQLALDGKSNAGHNHDVIYYQKAQFLSSSSGSIDGGSPIVLASNGQIDPTMTGTGAYLVASFTPTSAEEYPDTTGHRYGAWWLIDGVDPTNGYEFTTGSLTGKTIYNGNALMYGETTWAIFEVDLLPTDYYKRDGSQPLTANLRAGGHKLSDVEAGTDDSDAVTVFQLASELNAGDTATLTSANNYTDTGDAATLSSANSYTDTAIATREPTITAGNDGEVYTSEGGDKVWKHLTNSSVGLGNVDNTSDADKPISTATQTALDTKLNSSAFLGGLGLTGETWVDEIANRVVDVEYTNDTGKPIMVHVSATSGTSNGYLEIEVDGILLRGSGGNSGFHEFVTVIVPNGSIYKITTAASPTLTDWFELK